MNKSGLEDISPHIQPVLWPLKEKNIELSFLTSLTSNKNKFTVSILMEKKLHGSEIKLENVQPFKYTYMSHGEP